MRRTVKEKRLRAIKSKFMILARQCECCKEEVSFETMWEVKRWGVNNRIYLWNYCKRCMHTAEDVLNQIDNDACPWGIAYVDPQTKQAHKEKTLKLLQELEEKKQKNKKNKK